MNIRKFDKTKQAKAEKMLRAGKPMTEIATAVGVSIPTLYSYFPGGARGMREKLAAEAKPAKSRKQNLQNTRRKAA